MKNSILSLLVIAFAHGFSMDFRVVQGNVTVVKEEQTTTVYFSGPTILKWDYLTVQPEETLRFLGLTKDAEICNQVSSLGAVLIDGKLCSEAPLALECAGDLKISSIGHLEGATSINLSTNHCDILGKITVKQGEIEILGNEIQLQGASILADDAEGGGKIFIGQSLHSSQKAQRVTIDSDSFLSASALESGDGGSIVIWSEESTQLYGKLEARGGFEGGNGGFIEVSGRKHLVCEGSIDRRAPFGRAGMLLLDPEADISIQASGSASGSFGSGPPFTYDPASTSNVILIGPGAGTLLDFLDQGDVTIQTSYGGSAGPFGGRITLIDDLIYSSPSNLTLIAGGENIAIQAELENDGMGSIHLEAPNGSVIISPSPGNKATVVAGGGVSIANVSGDVILQGGSGDGEKVIIGDMAPVPPTGNFSMSSVGGSLIVQAGSESETSASILTQAGTITIDVVGDVILRSGPISPSEAFIAGIPGNAVTITCGGDLIMEKGSWDAADYMLIGNETTDPVTLTIGDSLRMVGDVGYGGPVISTYGDIIANVTNDLHLESSANAQVIIFGEVSAHFTVGGTVDLINPEIISNDFQILP